MNQTDEQIRERIVEMGNSTLDIVQQIYNDEDIKPQKQRIVEKMLGAVQKVLYMNQVKVNTERSQAIRLLPWLKDDAARAEYMRLTNPQVAPLMLSVPKNKKK